MTENSKQNTGGQFTPTSSGQASGGQSPHFRESPAHATAPSASQPVLAMSSLGQLGRFGNQIIQYFFLRLCAQKSGARVECPPWIGQRLFGHHDAPVTSRLPPAIERWEAGENMWDGIPELIPYLEKRVGAKSVRVGLEALERGLANVDLWGHFQVHTCHLRPHQRFFRSLFQPVPELKTALDEGLIKLRAAGKTIIGIHLRRGDFLSLPHFGFTHCVPSQWWCDWLRDVWEQYERPVLFLCSDDLKRLLPDFKKYSPMTSRDLRVSLPDRSPEVEDYLDFYLLSQSDVVGISNSTFSFVACLLNEEGRRFVRPHWDFRTRFTEFDPWNSPPLLYHGGENPPQLFKTFRQALTVAQATGGARELSRCFFVYPWAMVKMKANRAVWGAQTSGVKGLLKSLVS